MIEGKKYEYYKHIITADGHVYNQLEKEIKINKRGMVRITINGKKHSYKAGRLVYEAVTGVPMTDPLKTGNDSRKTILIFKDGNCMNAAFDNLIMVTREEYFKDKEWSTAKFSKETKAAICKDFFAEGEAHISLRKLAKKYNCSVSFVQNVIGAERKRRASQIKP